MKASGKHIYSSATIQIRDFEKSNYPDIAKINNVVFPDMIVTGDDYIDIDSDRNPMCKHRRWIAKCNNDFVGTCTYSQNILQYNPHTFIVWVVVLPDFQNRGIGTALYNHVINALNSFSPSVVQTYARDDFPMSVRFIEKQGFRELRRNVERHLDVSAFNFGPYCDIEDNLKLQGIEIKTAHELENDPDRNIRLYDLHWKLSHDTPEADMFKKTDLNTFIAEELNSTNARLDAYFVAVHGDEYVGQSRLKMTEGGDSIITGLTGVIRDYRRRQIATAMKIRTIDYARKHNLRLIKTGNDSTNTAMITLNKKLGFIQRPAWISFSKTIKERSKNEK